MPDISQIRHLINKKMPGILATSLDTKAGTIEIKNLREKDICLSINITNSGFTTLLSPFLFQSKNCFDRTGLEI